MAIAAAGTTAGDEKENVGWAKAQRAVPTRLFFLFKQTKRTEHLLARHQRGKAARSANKRRLGESYGNAD
jgi:hypothetical protein